MILYFKNPVFNPGVNVTVRLGDKWFGSTGARNIHPVHNTETSQQVGLARIVTVFLSKLGDIPMGILALEHDPSCVTREGILAEMQRVYAPTVGPDDLVTVILFQMVRSMERADVYEAIDSERDYQNRQVEHNHLDPAPRKSIEEFTLYMEDYLAEMRTQLSRTWGPMAYEKARHTLRKILALGVACAEQHPLPLRETADPVYTGTRSGAAGRN